MKDTPKAIFKRLYGKNASLLSRCEQYAAWTIPSKFPQENVSDDYQLATDFQSIGAKCVNNLLNKVMLAIFAPSRPFFRPELTQAEKKLLADEGLQGAALDAVLSQVAKLGMKNLEELQVRQILTEVIAQLLITGNSLLRFSESTGEFEQYTLRDYVVRRKNSGAVVEHVSRESAELQDMPQKVQDAYLNAYPGTQPHKILTLYTRVRKVGNVWKQEQSIEDVMLPAGSAQYAEKDNPWRVLVWSLAPKRNYGTGPVEEAQNTFHALSVLSQAQVPGLVEMCRIVHLADPGGSTDALEFQNALSGSVINGKEGDITTPDLGGKMRDYATVEAKIEKLERTLSEMFLVATSAVRNAERVTAEEIRLLAQELETSMGGVYTRLSTDLQQWLASLAIKRIQEPKLRKLKVYVVTGMDALSANGDLDNLRALMSDLAITQNVPDEIKATIIWDSYVQLLAALHNVDYFKFLKSQDVARAEQADQQAQVMDMQAAQVATEAAGQVAVNNLSNQGE